MKYVNIISRFVVGVVFIFSGFVKAVDPFGTAYKFQDYFTAFNLPFLSPLGMTLSILLCSAEFLGGFSLLFNVKIRQGIWVVFLLMSLFTPLTLILALTNPVSDCGCFGDAIHLTNWQTFFKNIIIFIPTLYLFINRKKITRGMCDKAALTLVAGVAILFLIFIFYNLRYLPIIDFRPYKIGNNISEQMIIPEGMPTDEYATTFIYERDGEQREFTLENYPADDTSWVFVDSKTTLVTKGYEPPVHDFFLTANSGYDVTEAILTSDKYIMFMVSKKLTDAGAEKINEGLEFGRLCNQEGIDFYLLTASGEDEMTTFGVKEGLRTSEYDSDGIFTVDETTLKTIVRANPGYVLIKKGTVVGKWSWAKIPDINELHDIINNK